VNKGVLGRMIKEPIVVAEPWFGGLNSEGQVNQVRRCGPSHFSAQQRGLTGWVVGSTLRGNKSPL